MMEKVGPVAVRNLIDVLGSARAVFEADAGGLMQARGIGRELAATIQAQRRELDWEGEEGRAAELGARLITPLEDEYPPALKEIHDPPLALYVQGQLESRDRHAIAVVGTRRPTHYGRETAERFGYRLGQTGWCVISGLAAGVDTAAHKGALKAKGRTLAVLGSALDCIYPAENSGLAREIAKRGAVISEFPLGRRPDKTTFPMRNRIVSGMSRGVLVVEADTKSGALITANQALEQGRNVFAVPGRIDSPASRGTNDLLKRGAAAVTSIDDIEGAYEFLIPPPRAVPEAGNEAPKMKLTVDEQKIVDVLGGGDSDVDAVIRATGLQPAVVGSLLISMEMKRIVRTLPGRIVALNSGAT